MYYIKETYPNSNNISSNILFKAWLDNFIIREDYTNWTLSGDIYIFSNSFLPNYSYSLNISNHLFEIKNINLVWSNEIISKNTSTGNTAYNITKYTFLKTINLSNSYIYKQEISDESIYFTFTFNFNQNIFMDFDVQYNENIRRKFINQIDLEYCEYEYFYSNTYYLNNQTHEIYVDNIKKNKIVFSVPNFFDINKPINNILFISKNQNIPLKLKYLEIKIKYKNYDSAEWKELLITRKNIDYIQSIFPLSINDFYEYDLDNDLFYKASKKSYKGIFIPKKSIGNISLNMLFEYDNNLKRIIFDRQFRFEKNYYEQCINAISHESLLKSINNYTEVIYGI